MKFGIIFIGLLAFCLANPQDEEVWKQYKARLGSSLTKNSKQEALYKTTFLKAKNSVDEQNALYENQQSTYKAALNDYSHLPEDEFIAKRTGFKQSPLPANPLKFTPKAVSSPQSKDWHLEGFCTSTKNQGECGSCYSFAVAAAIEGQSIRYAGINTELSNQQIVDCSTNYGNLGCEGGFPDKSFQYVIDSGGLTSFASYPYANGVGACRIANPLVTIASHRRYVNNSPEGIKQLLCEVGPLVVAIKATPQMSTYAGGVYKDPSCGPTTPMNELNHAVTLVGYGIKNGELCWKIKNSWGGQWGEQGYIWMAASNDHGVKNDIYVPNK